MCYLTIRKAMLALRLSRLLSTVMDFTNLPLNRSLAVAVRVIFFSSDQEIPISSFPNLHPPQKRNRNMNNKVPSRFGDIN
jgi:hypothetical protein